MELLSKRHRNVERARRLDHWNRAWQSLVARSKRRLSFRKFVPPDLVPEQKRPKTAQDMKAKAFSVFGPLMGLKSGNGR